MEVDYSDLPQLVGKEIGASQWVEITQKSINDFSDATGDNQWIHVDVERANAEFGGTIAHGYYILSLIPRLWQQALRIRGVKNGLNYGLNRLRFTNMVRCGARVRLNVKIKGVEPKGEGQLLTCGFVMEIEGESKPALITEALFLIIGE